MVFEHFPYSNFHDLNMDWILRTFREMEKQLDEFVFLNTIKYADPFQWDITTQYAKNTIVIDPATGDAYISVQPVPSGVLLSNTDYWSVIFNYQNVIDTIKENIATDAGDSNTAPVAIAEGDLVWWKSQLYKAITNIVPGTAFVVDTNVEKYTVDEKINDALNAVATETADRIQAITEEADAREQAITEEADAREQADEELQEAIDTETTNRENADAALSDRIDQIANFPFVVTEFGAVGDGSADDTEAFRDTIAAATAVNGSVFIPSGSYKLTEPVFAGSNITLINNGTYPDKKVVQSKKLKQSTFPGRSVFAGAKNVYGTNSNAAIQALCYDSTRDRFVLGFSYDRGTPQLVAVSPDFKTVLAGPVSAQYGHANDLTYDSKRDLIYCAAMDVGDNANCIITIDPSSLAIRRTALKSQPVYQVSYDADNDFVVYISGQTLHFAEPETFTDYMQLPYNSPAVAGIPGSWGGQSSVIIDGQFFMLYSDDHAFLLVQYDYATGDVLNWYAKYWEMAEAEAMDMRGTELYMISGQYALTISAFDVRNAASSDIGYLADGGIEIPSNADIHDYLSMPGRYWCPSGAVAGTLANMPAGYDAGGFTLITMRTAFDRIKGFMFANDARTIYTITATTGGIIGVWLPIPVHPGNNTAISTIVTTAGFVTNSGKTIQFQIPIDFSPMRNGTFTSGKITIRSNGNTVVNEMNINNSAIQSMTLTNAGRSYRATIVFNNTPSGMQNNSAVGVLFDGVITT